MKRTVILIKLCLILCALAVLAAIGDYLALHDIANDYVSRKAIASYESGLSGELPRWSETKLEWRIVNAGGLIKVTYLVLSAATLYLCLKALKKKEN